jgi:dienelactone hydrolase
MSQVNVKATSLALALALAAGVQAPAQSEAPSPRAAEDGMRMPWTRQDGRFLRRWLIVGTLPGTLDQDLLAAAGGEAAVRPAAGHEVKRPDGSVAKWANVDSYSDAIGLEGLEGPREGVVAYAFARVTRPRAGKALLAVGSDEGVRVWVNGTPVLSRDGLRSLTYDEDQVEVELREGENAVLVKVPQQMGAFRFSARVLEPGTVLPRRSEVGCSITRTDAGGFTLKTDIGAERREGAPVTVEVVAAGGRTMVTRTAARGAALAIDARSWPDGPYEARCSTRSPMGRLHAGHLAWYKGDALAKARELAAAAAAADPAKPEGFTLRMLASMVDDRLGQKVADARENVWWRIHSPLMEFDELMLERRGQAAARIRPHGFVRLAYRDEVDGSPQFCRAYLPAGYDPAKKWPVVVQIHGFNPANPVYWRWWSADSRHPGISTEFANGQGVIYLEPHGRGNTTYLGMGDSDVLRAIGEAKRLFSVDEDRVYLTGDSMGGWGTWNVATRHPDLFAAIAPVFGGSDYHVDLGEEQLAALAPVDRFSREKQSSWAMADSLLNVPILVHHGDADRAVKVDYSRWGVRLLQRWGYDVQYHEYPGYIHEALGDHNANLSIEWFLKHRRNPDPRKVRLRSAELRNASAYWVRVEQAESPRAFMAVDAEVVGHNLVRLDTENVLEVSLSPRAALVDPKQPLKVVWNGESREAPLQDGRVRLRAEGHVPAATHKSPARPGSIGDFTVTPFAVVVGTTSKDPDMVALCAQKARAFADNWREWQKQEPRVFQDTEISEADLARYSLLLIGGPDANRVSALWADRLPLRVEADAVTIDGKRFAARDAAVQMLYAHPAHPERYVLVIAAASADGMYFADPRSRGFEEWDYVVLDGRIPAFKQTVPAWQTRVVSGHFGHDWRLREGLAHLGDPAVREKGRLLRRPRGDVKVDPKVLESYVGRYQIERGPVVEVFREGDALMALGPGQRKLRLVAESEADYVVADDGIRLTFVREGAKVTGMTGYDGGRDFTAARLD